MTTHALTTLRRRVGLRLIYLYCIPNGGTS
jgi:hypothetical protein